MLYCDHSTNAVIVFSGYILLYVAAVLTIWSMFIYLKAGDGQRKIKRFTSGDLPFFGHGICGPAQLCRRRRVVAGSQPAGFVVCDLPPGPHEVAVANLPLSTNLFGHGNKRSAQRAPAAPLISPPTRRWGVTPGQITLVQVTENQGRADVASLHQTKGVCGKA